MVFGHSSSSSGGVLTVTVCEGKDLKDQDAVGKNDPYVEMWLDEDYKQRSSTINNTNNPVWNETFSFNVPAGSHDKKLYLKVLDKDLVSSSDKIGDTKVDLKDVYMGKPFEGWVKLPAKLGLSSHGEILLRMHFAPN
ncbi:C2 domain-containing protein [Zychaea mexicana]|uniref:C2 domain-containing protein n=1 Tax=Zychaea mexicana TaxID=64656 RepID=UPI0022FF3C95|nr:C2 domain-containing protein [Zychaea mexicana]KAI9484588.1 C2 domain-containing protein [Zychaea mexicana]